MHLSTANLVWLIPALPLIGFFIHAFLGKRLGKKAVGTIATSVVFASFVVSVVVLMDLLRLGGERRAIASLLPGAADVPWIHIGDFRVDYNALIDPLSMLMCLIVTGVGGLIHLYATGYMAEDRDYPRFFTYLNLFIFFMLMLVLGGNILLMFVGWEGVGLCSYLLISFWFEDVENSKAGNKAFIVNRIGDVGFALGVMTIFSVFGTLTFRTEDGKGFLDLAQQASGPLTAVAATTIGLLLFVGASGKSAQFPLHVWLPDAMAGPTPVSALIHAATMVTAGVVMITRVSPIIVQSEIVMLTIACVGLFTAVFAATIALTQNDIKKVLAYSTVSQLGYMFLGCGVGAFTAGMFHVTTHAFFKALLFLGAGSVIHAMHHEQDMRRMGGLAKKIPITYWTMVFGWLAICGIPPLAGFWSKDEVLGAASGFRFDENTYGMIFYWVGLATAALTAFYMSRLMWKTFWTHPRFDEAALGHHAGDSAHGVHATHHAAHDPSDPHGAGHAGEAAEEEHPAAHVHRGVHESPRSMLIPLVILAALSVVGGLIGTPYNNIFEHFLRPSVADYKVEHAIHFMPWGALLGTAAGAFGIAMAYVLYSRRRETGDLLTAEQRTANPLYRGSLSLWGVDGFLTYLFVTVGGAFASIWAWFDKYIIDGIVNLLANIAGILSETFRRMQTGYIRVYALSMLIGVVFVIAALLWPLFSGEPVRSLPPPSPDAPQMKSAPMGSVSP
jgi:NADH-quinone oxidoreductase subunit L